MNDARLIVSQHPGLLLELELMMMMRHDELRLHHPGLLLELEMMMTTRYDELRLVVGKNWVTRDHATKTSAKRGTAVSTFLTMTASAAGRRDQGGDNF